MEVATKNPADPKPVPSGPAWLAEIAYYDDAEATTSNFTRTLLLGLTGSGKTHLIGTYKGIFVFDYDAGGLTLRKQKVHGQYLSFLQSRGCVRRTFDVIDAALAKRPPFDKGDVETIAFDTLTDFSNMAVEDFMLQAGKDPLNAKPSYDEYGKLKANCIELGRRLKRLSSMYNVVVSAKCDIDKDEMTGAFVGGPILVGAYRGLIGGDFDEVYYLESETVKEEKKYFAYTGKRTFYDAKSRLGLPYRIENPSYEKIMQLAKVASK